jgi:hypothetical protein
MLKISREEKSIQFIYLLAFWVVTTIVFCIACFHNYSTTEVRSKYLIVDQINKQNIILKEQQNNLAHIDSLNKMLLIYNPSTSLVYLESSINYELDELKKIYEQKKADKSYKIFNELTGFYSMQFFDKKATWNSTNNSAFLKKNLEECEIGFQQKQDNLNIKNALSTGDKK